jgi:parallel beta-helix repeat protein
VQSLAAGVLVLAAIAAFAAPAQAAPGCGETVTSDTTLTQGITGCSGDGLVIGADGVDLDLAGHTIEGKGLGVGVRNDGHDNVTVTNGTIAKFDYGVVLRPGAGENLVQGLTLRENENMALKLSDADGNGIRDNQLVGSKRNGLVLLNGSTSNDLAGNRVDTTAVDAVRIVDSPNNDVESTTIATSGDEGLVFRRSRGAALTDSTISGTSDAGVAIAASRSFTLTGNEIKQTSDAGVSLTSSNGTTLVGNRLANTGDTGFALTSSEDTVLRGNTLSGAGDDGVTLVDSTGNTILENTVNGASDSGVELQSSNANRVVRNQLGGNPSGVELWSSNTNVIRWNDASLSGGFGISLDRSGDNRVLSNTANGNGASGIYVKGESTTNFRPNILDGNTTNENKARGIYVESVRTRLTGNVAERNASWGIWAVAGVGDGGGNHANSNGEALQCFNISCIP